MLGFKSISESALSTYGALPELLNNVVIRGTAKLDAVGNLLNYAGSASYTTASTRQIALTKIKSNKKVK